MPAAQALLTTTQMVDQLTRLAHSPQVPATPASFAVAEMRNRKPNFDFTSAPSMLRPSVIYLFTATVMFLAFTVALTLLQAT
jgi:hypothetical protein